MKGLKKRLGGVQAWLGEQKIDGWLICDFRGSNPFAAQVLELGEGIYTRRWYAWIPAKGEPTLLVHDIEYLSFAGLGLELLRYNGRESLSAQLQKLLAGAKTVAMEYSPDNNNPYISKIDAGTVDLLRSFGLEVRSSGDLLQLFLTWTPAQLRNHRKAAKALEVTKDAAFALLQIRVSASEAITEFELQTYMLEVIEKQGMETDHAPTVGFGEMAAVGHYSPSASNPRVLQPGPVLMDLWCKVPGDNPYADIAWMAHWGTPSLEFDHAFGAALAARDLGIEFLQARFSSGQPVRGYEVDRIVRNALTESGYPNVMRRRTGHSLGITAVHGDVVHFDDFETLDDRLVLPGLGFTIEPGFRHPKQNFGVHTEINLYTYKGRIEVTTPVQRKIHLLG